VSFPAEELEDRDRTGGWVVTAKLPEGNGAARWLLQEGNRAMAWVDVDSKGLARGWSRLSREQARLLDLSFGVRFTELQLQAVGERLQLGTLRPESLDGLFEAMGRRGTWSGHWVDPEGWVHDLWYVQRTGIVALTSNRRQMISAVECAVGMRAYGLLLEAARAAGEMLPG
jgi:hypothetical protein